MIDVGRSGNISLTIVLGGASRSMEAKVVGYCSRRTPRPTDTMTWRQGLQRVAGDTRRWTIFQMENYLGKMKIRQSSVNERKFLVLTKVPILR